MELTSKSNRQKVSTVSKFSDICLATMTTSSEEQIGERTNNSFTCPLQNCRELLTESTILSHFLLNHNEGIAFKEVTHKHHVLLQFAVDKLEFNKNFCIGYLHYDENTEDEPFESQNIFAYNLILPEIASRYGEHAPVVVMSCLTTWTALAKESELVAKYANCNNDLQVLLVWLVGTEATVKKLFTIRAHDSTLSESRSIELYPRNIRKSQLPEDITKDEINMLVLSRFEIKLLSQNQKEKIIIEVFPKEEEKKVNPMQS
ncbi:uncharacterized protein LOC119669594 [Teleopsis dalmanni]|uniref:uncharacterized protein LOC119669594 n=1 Tax=Teleopsis dalmanni TaxID=139649 RepID=UPI000D32B1E6|nr:uncharacterized protein LOC119669594 [Teleopsis dalmanni]